MGMVSKQNRESSTDYIPSGFQANLKHYRWLKGISEQELADMVGLTRGTISKYQNGMIAPLPRMVRMIAKALDISCDELLDDETELEDLKDND